MLWGAPEGPDESLRTEETVQFWEHDLPLQMADLAAQLEPGHRFDSIVVDETQDFADAWWDPLLAALKDDETGGLYVFTDEGQRVFNRHGSPPVPLVPLVLDHNLCNTEIEQDSNWRSSRLGILPIDLWDELAEVGESASQITEDREAMTELERSRLRDDPDVRVTIDEDRELIGEALTLLAARVDAFADYRDRVQLLSMYARRDSTALSRAVRRVADQQAKDRPL